VGATYYVISGSLADQYPWAVDSLRRYDMVPPSPSKPGRNPTPRELRTVLDELSGYTVDYRTPAIGKPTLRPTPAFGFSALQPFRNLPVEWEQGESYQFGIFDTLSGQFLGVCGLNHIN
jgi:hypothetical protein